jgi:hypothetical protein
MWFVFILRDKAVIEEEAFGQFRSRAGAAELAA